MIKIVESPEKAFDNAVRYTFDPKLVSRNPFTFILLLLALVGVIGVALVGGENGIIYFFIVLGGISVIVLHRLFFKSEQPLTEVPIATSIYASVLMYWSGIILISLFNIIGAIVSLPKFHQFIKPFAMFLSVDAISGLPAGQTLTVVNIGLSKFWQAFFTVFVAGTLEPLVFGFVAIIVGELFGFGIISLIDKSFNTNFSNSKHTKAIIFIFGMIISIILFVKAHELNASYTTITMFAVAGIFRLLSNFALYYFNLSLSFLIGLHMANNAWAFGIGNTIGGFFIWNLLAVPIVMIFVLSFLVMMQGFFIGKYKEILRQYKIGL